MLYSPNNPILWELRMFDGNDSTYLDAWFDVAEYLYLMGEPIPAEWKFRPSPFLYGGQLADPDSWDLEDYALGDRTYIFERIHEIRQTMPREAFVKLLTKTGRVLGLLVDLYRNEDEIGPVPSQTIPEEPSHDVP